MKAWCVALIVTACTVLLVGGCGKDKEKIFEPSPVVMAEIEKYGIQEAMARAMERTKEKSTAENHEKLAQILAIAGRGEEARKQLEKAVSLDPTHLRSALNLGRILLDEGQAEDAERMARGVLEKKPHHPEASELLGRALVDQEKTAEAVEILSESVKHNSKHVGVNYVLANALAIQERFEESNRYYEQALALEPDNWSVLAGYSDLALAMGNVDKALDLARRSVDAEPRVIQARFKAGLKLGDHGFEDEAIEHYKEILIIDPNFFPAANNLAQLLADLQRDTTAAVTWARKALMLAPNSAAVADTYGWALARDGQYEEALRVLQEVNEKRPGNPAVWYHLGWTKVKIGQKSEGLALIRKAAESDREDIVPLAQAALKEFE